MSDIPSNDSDYKEKDNSENLNNNKPERPYQRFQREFYNEQINKSEEQKDQLRQTQIFKPEDLRDLSASEEMQISQEKRSTHSVKNTDLGENSSQSELNAESRLQQNSSKPKPENNHLKENKNVPKQTNQESQSPRQGKIDASVSNSDKSKTDHQSTSNVKHNKSANRNNYHQKRPNNNNGNSTNNQNSYGYQNNSYYSQSSSGYAPYYSAPRKKSNKGLIVFIIILIIALALAGLFAFWNHSFFSSNNYNTYSDYGYDTSEPHLSVIEISGTISENTSDKIYSTSTYNQKWLLNIIDSLMNDSSNMGIILHLNTPGGSVYATDEIYLKLLDYKQNTGKPIYVSMGSTCASGGYYISCAADKIYANRNSTTGSIGVIMSTFIDISEFLNNYGIKTTTLTTGKNKAMGNMYSPITDEQIAIYQSILDESYIQFVEIVAAGRNMDIENVKGLADGRIYTALQAKNNGLIDDIKTLEETEKQMISDLGLSSCPVYSYSYTQKTSLMQLISSSKNALNNSDKQDSDLAAAIKMAEEFERKPYYLAQ